MKRGAELCGVQLVPAFNEAHKFHGPSVRPSDAFGPSGYSFRKENRSLADEVLIAVRRRFRPRPRPSARPRPPTQPA